MPPSSFPPAIGDRHLLPERISPPEKARRSFRIRAASACSVLADVAKDSVVEQLESPAMRRREANPDAVASIILGGGAGTRLFLLTQKRAKPAVPLGGCYRLIGILMSNCINSRINKIYVLTQFNS